MLDCARNTCCLVWNVMTLAVMLPVLMVGGDCEDPWEWKASLGRRVRLEADVS